MEKNFVFAVDVDGVLRDNLGIMVDLYNKEFSDNKKIEDITEFKTEVSFPKIAELTGTTSSQWFFQDHAKEIFLDAEPYKNAVEDIKKLREYGKIIIVTYQKSVLNKQQTIEWLDKNGFEYDGLCFLKDKTLVHADYFIDDNNWNFINNNCKHGILIDAPYNKDTDIEDLKMSSNCISINRCKTIHEFVKKFVKNTKQKEAI